MRNLTRFVAAHNPFYLLSALSMLLGCYLLSRALALEPGQAGKLIQLIGVLNVYEALLIALALFLIVRRGLVRDGRGLLWLECVFLADATFLGSELYASDLTTGTLVAGVLRGALANIPLVSLAAHLIGAGFVQGLDFHPCFLGPPLVALAMGGALRAVPSAASAQSLWLPAMAVFVSLGAPRELVVTGGGGLLLSPLRVTLLGAGLAYLLAFRVQRWSLFAWAAGLCLGGAWAGHSVAAMASSVTGLWRVLTSWPKRMVPRTTGEWGLCAIGLSFVLLALGAIVSLRRPRGSGSAGGKAHPSTAFGAALRGSSEA